MMRVIGAGFGRTGTKSLQAALEQLGFAPCYHMTEVIKNPRHVPFWEAANRGEAVDWRGFFAAYGATVDWPGCTYYAQLMDVYPDAKVLLSVRDPERWYTSTFNTIYGIPRKPAVRILSLLLPPMRRFVRMVNGMVWHGTFQDRFADRDFAISIFNAHNAAVTQQTPPKRLLVFDVKEGWEPLCNFLEVPVPDTPFPHLNDAKTFRRLWFFATGFLVVVAVVIVAILIFLLT
ncbi:MAG: sulfotransferase [Caldilineaceae bacterium]